VVCSPEKKQDVLKTRHRRERGGELKNKSGGRKDYSSMTFRTVLKGGPFKYQKDQGRCGKGFKGKI